jgi:DNA excision repair protein ERCC-4
MHMDIRVLPTLQESVINQAAIDLLRSLPGVTDTNWRAIMNGVGSLRQLADVELTQLEQMMGGAKAARALYDFLHAPCPVAQTAAASMTVQAV